MDLKALLNNEDKDDSRHPAPQAKRPPPPPLSTTRSATHNPHAFAHHAFDSPQRYSNPPIAQSPGSLPPPSAQSFTSTPHCSLPPPNYQSPYQRSAPLPSPGRSGSLPGGYFPPAQQRPPSHHSLHRSSTSPLEPAPPYHDSPPLNRAVPPFAPQQLQPHTPLGPPPVLRHDSTHSLSSYHDSPAPSYQRHRSSSGASHLSPPVPPLPPPNSAIPRPESLGRRESYQSSRSYRIREESVSVSPKTVLQALPKQSSQMDTMSMHPPQLQALQKSPGKPTVDQTTIVPNGAKLNVDPLDQGLHNAPISVPIKPHQGVKREADAPPTTPDVLPSTKKPRTTKPPPIWARQKRSLRPLNKNLKSNGLMARSATPIKRSPSEQPQSQPTFTGPIAGNTLDDRDYDQSIRDIVPMEDITRQVLSFIHQKVIVEDPEMILPFEIEAKVGRLVEHGDSEDGRIEVPVLSETIINASRKAFSFESKMTEAYHKTMNDYLNESVILSNKTPEPGNRARRPMEYKRSREIDAFYELPPGELGKLPLPIRQNIQRNMSRRKPRVRVTRDMHTGEVIAKVIKTSVGDLNVYCPNSKYDWRVSINLEYQWDGSVDALEELAASSGHARGPNRNKDRLSYKHQFCQIDLTQVKIGQGPGGSFEDISHELEIELDLNVLREQARLLLSGQKNRYQDYVKVFLDNVRTLARHEANQGK